MGKITTTLTVTNYRDEVRAEAGVIQPAEVRSLIIPDVLIDTGATTLCLPSDLIAQLGLRRARTVDVSTANGISQTGIYEAARISLLSREGIFECLELPGGTRPLLGVIPLEAMGIEPDLATQTLRLLPVEGKQTYLTAL